MQTFMEYIPLIAFFVVYKTVDIYYAAGALIAGYMVVLSFSYFTKKPIKKSTLYLFAFTVVMAGLTIAFQDEAFLKWKFSVLYFAAGIVLLGSRYMFQANLIKKWMGQNFTLPEKIWDQINIAWVGFCFFCASLNIYIFDNWSLDAWVNFKVFGVTGMMFVFIILTVVYIYPYLPEEEEEQDENQAAIDNAETQNTAKLKETAGPEETAGLKEIAEQEQTKSSQK